MSSDTQMRTSRSPLSAAEYCGIASRYATSSGSESCLRRSNCMSPIASRTRIANMPSIHTPNTAAETSVGTPTRNDGGQNAKPRADVVGEVDFTGARQARSAPHFFGGAYGWASVLEAAVPADVATGCSTVMRETLVATGTATIATSATSHTA